MMKASMARIVRVGVALVICSFGVLSFAKVPREVCLDLAPVIAEPPVDEMGTEFQNIFGQYLNHHTAYDKPLNELATEIFLKRLDLAAKYNTFFSQEMSRIGLSGKPRWQERLMGYSKKRVWSFGQTNQGPRQKGIWEVFKNSLSARDSQPQRMSSSIFKEVSMRPLDPQINVSVWTWKYPHKIEGQFIEFKTYQLDSETYFVQHALDAQVPALLRQLNQLWLNSLNPKFSDKSRVQSLVEFEWLWFWTNPYGRAGALTGDALALLAQKAMKAQGIPIKIRANYLFQDLIALTNKYEGYVALRMSELLPTHADLTTPK